MSLMPRINFPINFYFWEGSSPSSKETKGRKEEEEGEEREGRGGETEVWPCITLHLPHSPSPACMGPQPCYGLNVCVPLNLIY